MSNEIMNINENNNTQLPNTLAITDPKSKNRALRALNASESLASAIAVGEPFEVVDIFQTPGIRRARQEGALDTPCINTYFLITDGRSLMTQSDGIARSVQMLLSPMMYPECGRSTEEGFIRLAVYEQKLPNGNSLKSIIPVD